MGKNCNALSLPPFPFLPHSLNFLPIHRATVVTERNEIKCSDMPEYEEIVLCLIDGNQLTSYSIGSLTI